MKLDFFYEQKPAGCFLELTDYPTAPGRYRYMPYRSPGHLAMQQACKQSGAAICTYPTATGPMQMSLRCEEYGVVEIAQIEALPH